MKKVVSFAGISFSVDFQYTYLESLLGEYSSWDEPEFCVSVTQKMIEAEREKAEAEHSDAYLETLAFYRAFCTMAADYGMILFHSCVMEADGKAYLFAAPSGTGKSTHCNLWLQTFGERVKILNGDKPLLRVMNGIPTVYGTPFMGKENLGYNGSAHIGGICFLERGKENCISRIGPQEAMVRAFSQLFVPTDGTNAEKIIQTQIEILNSVPLWSMKCNISEEAAKMSFNAMIGGKL